MKRKRGPALLALLALTAALFSGCATGVPPSDSPGPTTALTPASLTPAETVAPAEDGYRVLCLLNGTLGDRGFYDSMAEGLERLHSELGWTTNIIEMGKDDAHYESYFLEASESGEWDLIVTATFSVKPLLERIAVQFPAQKYMILDVAADFSAVTTNNVMGVTYRSNEAGFLGGALAALMLRESGQEKLNPEKPVLGFVGSVDAVHINDFLVGYMEGISYIDPNIKLLSTYVGSFGDVPKCLEITEDMYRQGAQIIYAPASQSVLGAVQACADADKFFVACDNDVWTITETTDPELVSNVLSSTMKHVGNSLFDAAKGLKEGTYKVGENYVLGIREGAIGLADNPNYRKLVPQDIRDQLAEITRQISDGEIVVSSSFTMDAQTVAALRDGMKP